ncbi:MAG: type IV pilus modification protein PilV, partial [Litorivicinus sp.]
MQLARGISLVEVLVSLLILSLGLLGFASLQAANLNLGNEAWLRSQATVLASDMIDRVRGNSASFEAGHYDHAFASTPSSANDCTAVDCNPVQLAAYDLS